MNKSRLNRYLFGATSLVTISAPNYLEGATTLTFSEDLLGRISPTNPLIPSPGVRKLDFKNLTPEIVKRLGNMPIDLSGFEDVREIVLPWFASQLNIQLPSNFTTPKDFFYGVIKVVPGSTPLLTDSDLAVDLSHILSSNSKVVVDAKEVPIKALNAGGAVQVRQNASTKHLTVTSQIELIDNVEDTSVKIIPSNTASTSSPDSSFEGLPSAVMAIGDRIKSIDLSRFKLGGKKELNVVSMPNLQTIITAPGDMITSLRTTGEKAIEVSAPIQKLITTSSTPDQTAMEALAQKATLVAPLSKEGHIESFVGKTELDFSKLDLGSVDTTSERIKEIFASAAPVNTIVSMKIGASVLAAVMTKLSISNLSSFTALKKLEIMSASGAYQSTSLTAAQLPSGLEEFYSSNLAVRRGTLTGNLAIDKKFSVAEIDLSGLILNGHTLSISSDFLATAVNTLKLNHSLLGTAAISNLIAAGASKSIIVSGAAGGALDISNLQNVGTIDLREVTGATAFSAALDIDGSHTNLTQLSLPSGFDLTAANVLAGVDNGETTVHISGAYSGSVVLDASYNNAILNFSGTTGTGRFQLPSGVRGLVLSSGVSGINVGAAATANQFNLAGLTRLRQLSGLPSTATVLNLNNNLASASLDLNLSGLNALTTLRLNSSKVTRLTLPQTATLTDGGSAQHLNMSQITDLSELLGLDELLAQGSLTEVSFPLVPASNLHINLSATVDGINFNNMGQIPYLTLDNTYAGGAEKWPTVIDKTKDQDWGKFFNYLLAPTSEGGANSPTIFDLSGQMIESAAHATALVSALNNLSSDQKNALQKLIIRFASGCVDPIDFSDIETTDFSHASLLIALDQSTGSTSTITLPAAWNSKTKSYVGLDDVTKTNAASWTRYLSYRFSSTGEKGEGATSLDLSSLELSATEWAALMTALNGLDSNPLLNAIQTIHIKLATDASATAPQFTTSTLTNLSSVVVDITGVKNTGAQVAATGLPAATPTLTVEQRVNNAAAVDRTSTASWQGYIEHLLRNISGTAYTLDLTDAALHLYSSAQLTALNAALAGLSTANKAKIQRINLKIEALDNFIHYNVQTDLTDFDNLTRFIVDATGALNTGAQSLVTFNLQNAPSSGFSAEVHVTSLASVDLDSKDSWDYYLAYRLATSGVELTNLDLSAVQFTAQADLTAFLTSLNGQTSGNKSTVQSIKFKLAPTYTNATFDLGADIGGGAEASGFDHGSFSVTVDRNGANAANPVNITFGSSGAANPIRSTDTTILDTSFTGLATFDPTDPHHWLGYVRTLLGTVAPAATITLDLSTHTNLEMDNANSAAFITAMNALPAVDKAKVATLKIKLAAGDFGAAAADFSGLSGFSGLTDLIINRNGARSSVNLYDPAVTVTGPGTITVNDPELRTITTQTQTNEWLSYVRFVLNGMTGIANTLDLSAFTITSANEATAFNNAIQALPSAEKLKIQTLKLSLSSSVTLGTTVTGLDNLDRIELVKDTANTITFDGDLAGKRTYLTNLAAVKMDDSTDWTNYLNYMLSTTNGGQSATSLNLNSRAFLGQTELDAFFVGLNTLNSFGVYGDKSALTTLRITLDDGLNGMSIGRMDNTPTAATDLATTLRVIVNPGTSTGTTHAGSNPGEVQADNLTVLNSTPAVSREHVVYLAEQAGFSGTIDLSSLTIADQNAVNGLFTDLESLPADIKAKIKVLNIKLASGNYGQSAVTLNALTGFTGLTINVDRNGALDGVNTYNGLVTLTNNSGHTANLTDAEFHNMATFDNEDSAHWIGYLTHELNSAPAGYTLDVSTNSALILDSVNSFAAFSSALRYLPDNLKTKVALLKVKASTSGDFGATDWNGPGGTEQVIPAYSAFDNLAKVIIDYTATGLNVDAYIGDLIATEKYAYITTPFSNMTNGDWERYFNYQLNDASNGGLGTTNITINQRLSAAQLTALLTGLDAAPNKAALANLTLNLDSSVVGPISLGALGLSALTTVTIHTNGSSAKLTPTDSFIGTANFLNASNINPTSSDSWAAYLAGQSSLAAIDIREIELANQAELSAFLTALNAATNKADVASIKLKLASGYSDFTVDFSAVAVAALTSLSAANSVEVHRNGNTATAIQGGDISNVKIKLVDLTAASLTDRSSAESWRRYLTQAIEDGGFAGTLDLASDSDTYLRTNAHVTAFMTGLQNLSAANKALVTDISIKLATSATWSNITDFGVGFSGFDSLTAFTIDATGAYVAGGAQATIGFHADLGGVLTQSIVTSLSAVDKDSAESWTYYIQGALKDQVAADYDLDLTSSSLAEAEFPALMTALVGISNGGSSNARDKIQKIRLKLAEGVWDSNLIGVGIGWNSSMNNIDTFTIDATGATVSGIQLYVSFHSELTDVSEYTKAFVTSINSVAKDNADAWEFYLNYLTRNGAAALNLSGITLSPVELNALDNGLNTFANTLGNGDLLSSIHIKVSGTAGAATVNLTADLDAQTAIDTPAEFIVDVSGFEYNGTQATVAHTGGTPKTVQLRVSDATKLYRASNTSWGYYFNHLFSASTPATLNLAASASTYLRNQADVTALMSALDGRADKGDITTLNVRLAPGNFGSDVVFTSTGGWNPAMTITVTGARNEGEMIEDKDVHFMGSMTSTSKTIPPQEFSSFVKDPTSDADWTQYLKTLLSPESDGGFNSTAVTIYSDLLPDAPSLTALMTGLQNLDPSLKSNLKHLYLDLSNIAGAIELGTGVSGFTALTEITYIRAASADADATAAIVGAGDFSGKIQRLRPEWNVDAITSTATMTEHLLYILMDISNGGIEQTTLDLTTAELADDTKAGELNTAINNLPADLKVRLTDLRLKLNAAVTSAATFDAAGLSNLATVIFIQGGGDDGSASPDNAPTWTDVGGVGFGSATKTRFRATVADIANKESPAQWTEYFAYHLLPADQGGLGETTIDASAFELGNDQVTWFWGGLHSASLDAYRTGITSITLAVQNNVSEFDGGDKAYNDNLKIIVQMNNHSNGTIILKPGAEQRFFAADGSTPLVSGNVIEHRITSLASVNLSSALSWSYYLNHLKATQGNIQSIDLYSRDLSSGSAQANVDAFFGALNARTSDRATVKDIFLNISGLDGLNISIGTGIGPGDLSGLESIVIRRHSGGASNFPAVGALDPTTRIAVITNNTAGWAGSVAHWKGYLAYLLEDTDHKGAGFAPDPLGTVVYDSAAQAPIFLNLTAGPLQVANFTHLTALETALTELPARLKSRISGVLIKTTDTSVDYTNGASYEFGDAFTTGILAEFSNLKAIIIESCTAGGTDPVFDTDGDFFNTSSVSKIVYHTTLTVA